MIGVSGKGSAQLGQGGIIYYVYTWLRSKATKWLIGSPYYVGKGSGLRAEDGTRMFLPPDYSFVKYFDKLGNIVDKPVYMAEQDAFDLEKKMIAKYGRIDFGTGCLKNHNDGGSQPPRFHELPLATQIKKSKANREYMLRKGAKKNRQIQIESYKKDPTILQRLEKKRLASLREYYANWWSKRITLDTLMKVESGEMRCNEFLQLGFTIRQYYNARGKTWTFRDQLIKKLKEAHNEKR